MKKVIVIFFACCFLSYSSAQTPNHGAKIEFENPDYDFGTVDKGSKVVYDFVFKNIGDDVLIVEKVFSNNYITAVDYTRTPVKPGEKGKVTLSFITSNTGKLSKLLTVKTNAVNVFRSMLCMKGEIIEPTEPQQRNGKWGIKKANGDIMIPFEYESLQRDNKASCFIAMKNGKYGCLDYSGKTIIPFEYEETLQYEKSGSCFIAKKNGKYGCLDYSGKTIIPFEYEKALKFEKSVSCFIANKNGKYGCLDLLGKTIVPFEFEEISFFANGYYKTKKSSGWGLQKIGGIVIYPSVANDIFYYSEYGDIYAINEFSKENNVWKAIKIDGGCVIALMLDETEGSSERSHELIALLLLGKTVENGLNKIDCKDVDENYLQKHIYSWK